MRYLDRQTAGKELARALTRFKGPDTVVLALPRGGVVTGAEVARALNAPFGLVLVRKIGHPSYPEYAIGALAEGIRTVYNEDEAAHIDEQWLYGAERAAQELIEQRREKYFGDDYAQPDVRDKQVLLVDDGMATGLTMSAAVHAVRAKRARKIIVAVPVAPTDSVTSMRTIADEVIVLDDPEQFGSAVGSHYQHFQQVDDDEVCALLREARDGAHQVTMRPAY